MMTGYPKSFPVKIQAMNIYWLLNSGKIKNQHGDFGLKFLKEIKHSNNDSLYESQPIVAIIEFLYQEFKSPYVVSLMIFNVIQFVFFFWSLILHERTYYPNHVNDYPSHHHLKFCQSMNVLMLVL